MRPEDFPESNCVFGPPAALAESQCHSVPAYKGEIKTGSCDGLKQVVVAWRFTKEEIEVLSNGGLLYLSVIGGLLPHYLSLSFHDATHPA